MIRETSGYCEICDVERAELVCRVCGRKVCKSHFDTERGVCAICATTLCEFCRAQLSVGYCISCGRMGCEDCMIQLSNVAYICKKCFSTNPNYKTLYRLKRLNEAAR
ncbi:MAG: hypothetical protein QXF49_06245 [Thermosphaera sp.]